MSVVEVRTQKGTRIMLHTRNGVGDLNIIRSVIDNDEYGLGDRDLKGVAFDIGAHIGAVTIPLVIDNPELGVIALEPVPANMDMLRENVAINAVENRVGLDGRMLADSVGQAELRYGWAGRNYWIGNLDEGGRPKFAHVVNTTSLTALLDGYEVERPALLKLDCEGCEWAAFRDPAIDRCDLIVGEFHDENYRRGADRVRLALEDSHDVSIREWTFTAERR